MAFLCISGDILKLLNFLPAYFFHTRTPKGFLVYLQSDLLSFFSLLSKLHPWCALCILEQWARAWISTISQANLLWHRGLALTDNPVWASRVSCVALTVVWVHSLASLRWLWWDKINLCQFFICFPTASWLPEELCDLSKDFRGRELTGWQQTSWNSSLIACSYGLWLFTVLSGWGVDVSHTTVSVAKNWALVRFYFFGQKLRVFFFCKKLKWQLWN